MPAGDNTYCEDLAEFILQEIAQGIPLRQICRIDGMPHYSTVYEWRKVNADFDQRFARAREEGADAIAEECFDIADDGTNDWIERENARTGQTYVALNDEHVQRSKLRIETRVKLLAKWFPQRYGEKLELQHKGEIGLAERLMQARKRRKAKNDGDELAG